MKNFNQSVAIFKSENIYCVIVQAVGMITIGEPNEDPQFIFSNEGDEVLGEKVLRALTLSRELSHQDLQIIVNSGKLNEYDEQRNLIMMEKFGYANKRSLYRNMKCCWVSTDGETIEILPSHHKSMDRYTARKDSGPHPVIVPAKLTGRDLGVAIRDAFLLCT